MKKIPLEDNFNDIVAKAQVGYRISLSELAEKSGVPTYTIQRLKSGSLDEAALTTIAPHLHLDAAKLRRIAQQTWYPKATTKAYLQRFNMSFPMPDHGAMTVNAYVLSDPTTKDAILFDTGTDATDILAYIEREQLHVHAILLTHTHRDHIHALHALKNLASKPIVYVNVHEPIDNAQLITDGAQLSCGSIKCTAKQTSGHSPGGTTYWIEASDTFTTPLAFVGDALFAGSVGGAPKRMNEAVNQIYEKILTLPSETILCPGHGPLTTVSEEINNNPFFGG